MFKEFKEFAMKGNMIDMAVGIILGGAFGAVVSALVEKIFMPIVGALTAGVDFSTLKTTVLGVEFEIGAFLAAFVNFLIIAFAMFLVVKVMNRLKKPEPAKEEPVKICPYCKSAIDMEATRCPHCTSEV